MTLDIKKIYLKKPVKTYEYLRLKLSTLPDNVIEEYKLHKKVTHDGCAYAKVRKGIYGLPQVGIIAQEPLEKRWAKQRYFKRKINSGFCTHRLRLTSFFLVVDDSGIKYAGKEHADHLIAALEHYYKLDKDWDGSKYIHISLNWDYRKHEVHLSMPGYVEKALWHFRHGSGKKDEDQLYEHVKPNYRAKVQYATEENLPEPLGKEEKTWIQQIVYTFLSYERQ